MVRHNRHQVAVVSGSLVRHVPQHCGRVARHPSKATTIESIRIYPCMKVCIQMVMGNKNNNNRISMHKVIYAKCNREHLATLRVK